MYVDVKHFEVKKTFSQALIDQFTHRSIVLGMPGFVKLEIGLNSKPIRHDEVNIMIYWDSYESYEGFKRSDVHREAHKKRKPNENILKHQGFSYELIQQGQ